MPSRTTLQALLQRVQEQLDTPHAVLATPGDARCSDLEVNSREWTWRLSNIRRPRGLEFMPCPYTEGARGHLIILTTAVGETVIVMATQTLNSVDWLAYTPLRLGFLIQV